MDWGRDGCLWPSSHSTVVKETGAAVMAQRDADPQSSGCFYSSWFKVKKTSHKETKRQEQVPEGSRLCAYAWGRREGFYSGRGPAGGPPGDEEALGPGRAAVTCKMHPEPEKGGLVAVLMTARQAMFGMGVWLGKCMDTTFLQGVVGSIIQGGPGTNTGALHLNWGGQRGAEEGGMRRRQLGQILQDGWEVTNWGEGQRSERW